MSPKAKRRCAGARRAAQLDSRQPSSTRCPCAGYGSRSLSLLASLLRRSRRRLRPRRYIGLVSWLYNRLATSLRMQPPCGKVSGGRPTSRARISLLSRDSPTAATIGSPVSLARRRQMTDDTAIETQATELLRTMIRNGCVNTGEVASGHEERSVAALEDFFAST